MLKIFSHILLLILFTSENVLEAQIVRGPTASELFINTEWYFDGMYNHYALFYSEDFGETLELNYKYGASYDSSFFLGEIFDDADPGVLYNNPYYQTDFGVSFDYGISWEPVEVSTSNGSFFSGKIHGEIFHYGFSIEGYLCKSNNYGQSFDTINSDVKYHFLVGVDTNIIYATRRISRSYNQYYLSMSTDNGISFGDWLEIDTSITGLSIEDIFRGAEPGEIYLVSRWIPDHYRIFFSQDYGQTWESRYRTMNIDFWAFSFTPGNESGIFYFIRRKIDPTWTFTLLHIYYSLDTAKTFTHFYHELTPEVGVQETEGNYDINKIRCFPVPATNSININNLQTYIANKSNVSMDIYNISGIKLEQMLIESNNDEIRINTSGYTPGLYFVVLKNGKQILTTSKFIVQR